MAVNVSGTVLASLFYDQSRSSGDQTGFLVGNVAKHVKDTISDSQINNVEVETNIYIYETVPCPRDQRFFTSAGQIKTKAVSDILNGGEKKIVGWYSFRRNSTLRPSYRERLLYHSLSECLVEDKNMFTFLLCSNKSSPNNSTHTLDYSFLRLVDNVFKRMPVNTANLGDTTHTEYKHQPSQTASKTQGMYSHLVHQHEQHFLNAHGQMEVRRIQCLNGSFSKKLEELSEEVMVSEGRLADIEHEVIKYRKQVRLKQLEKQQLLDKQNRIEVPNPRAVPITVEKKKPSVDDILFMDQLDSDSSEILPPPPPYEEITKNLDSSVNTNPVLVNQTETDSQNSETSAAPKKPPVKLSTPVSLHSRSNSMGQDKNLKDQKTSSPVHTRSKSNDSTDNLSKQSSDPFSFVSSVMAESKTSKSDSSSSKPSSSGGRVRRRSSPRGSDAGLAAAKTLNSAKAKGEGQRPEPKVDSIECNEMEVGDVAGSHRSKPVVSQSTKCSQQAAKETHTDSLDDSSASQDTYEMDVSSSPVY